MGSFQQVVLLLWKPIMQEHNQTCSEVTSLDIKEW